MSEAQAISRGMYEVRIGQVPKRIMREKDLRLVEIHRQAKIPYSQKPNRHERGLGNTHPTVKPLRLMRHFCKMLTPPGGVVLDPFMGSGTTGVAAIFEMFNFIGIEKDPEYFDVAQNRLERVRQ